jgi:3-methylcrotonyl-CoA carboxylase alpha subunit
VIESVLIANRGEIAVRIIATCRRLGVRTVAVYSSADAEALHVRMADDALPIGPPPAAQSYLNQQAILEAARHAGAEAIHPGYGFLSENADFAAACLEAGLTWIGPPPAAMRALGAKAPAKALAESAGVPTLPGYHGEDQSDVTLMQQAARIGPPLLIKASAGGGGRGMRLVEDLSEFDEALDAARREALSSFGDERVLLERFVRRPRHVEVQVLGDHYGALVYLGERECSIQRRNQKLIEETPSPAVDARLRKAMGEAAVRLCGAAGYSNAGTVEFLLDEQSEHRRFSFLEVNARLQVEHPITEAVTGFDLVEQQLRVTSGEPLGFSQSDIRLEGHAIEVRVVAEDPLAGWTPSTGVLQLVEFPPDVRVDGWIEPGTRVSPYYDSLLAKVIALAGSRAESIELLARALCETRIDGVRHNVDMLLAVLEEPEFRAGNIDTGFIERRGILDALAKVPTQVLAAATALDVLQPTTVQNPWQRRDGWRLSRQHQPPTWLHAGRRYAVRVTLAIDGRTAVVRSDGEQHRVRVVDTGAGRVRLAVDGDSIEVRDRAELRLVRWRGRSYRLLRAPAADVESTQSGVRSSAAAGQLTAPMPGRVVKIAVQTGDQVEQNQPLVVMEAMKMEHVVEAPHAGLVTAVCVQTGEQVSAGAVLLHLGSSGSGEAEVSDEQTV